MDHPLPPVCAVVRPWRTATIVASAVAALELVALVAAGLVLVAKPLSHHVRAAAFARAVAPVKHHARAGPRALPAGVPQLARNETSVLVLNGNGRSGAAGATAARIRRLGYIVGGVGNAPHTDYTRSLVMYRAGYRAEAFRLARDLRITIVGPLDGLKPAQLLGAHLALVIGA